MFWNRVKTWTLAAIMLLMCGWIWGQSGPDFMMQGWYWEYPKPGCNNYSGPSLAADMAAKANAQSNAGFTMMWLPPMTKASFGDCSNGYDPRDIFDYGNVTGQTGLGTQAEVDNWISSLTSNNMIPIADVVYNHRDGGDWEDNPVVNDYRMNYPWSGCSTATPYPVNGKVRYRLPVGGSSGNGAGDYYWKFSSASQDPGFSGATYKLYFQTSVVGFQGLPPIQEEEPNGGGDCGEPFQTVQLGVDIIAQIDDPSTCSIDEFQIILEEGQFNASGDFIELYIEEVSGGGTGIDIRAYSIWSGAAGQDVIADLACQTRTDFSNMPSNMGSMNYQNFKPNGITPTCLMGDLDFPYFFFDVEQEFTTTGVVYDEMNKWLWNTVGIRGYRLDAVKHFPAWFVGVLMNELDAAGIHPPMVAGEHFTSDAGVLKGWVDEVQGSMTSSALQNIQIRAFDFDLRDNLRAACESFGYDVRNIFNSGMVDAAGATGSQVVTFTNNHDFRFADVYHLEDPILSYAYILTNNRVGLPCVFYPDYYGATLPMDDGSFIIVESLQDEIDELIGIHYDHIFGADFIDYLSRFDTPYGSNYIQGGPNTTLLYQIRGGVSGKDVIVAINFAGTELEVNHMVNTGFPVTQGDFFLDQTGNAIFQNPQVENAGGVNNSIYIHLPPRSYAVYIQDEFLDVSFIDFEVASHKEGARLMWEVSSETEIDRFEIHRSLDGIAFEAIGEVEAYGQTEGRFSFMDRNFETDSYYRVKGIDVSGKTSITPIRLLKARDNKLHFTVSPNPIGEGDFVQISTNVPADESINMSLTNANGQVIHTATSANIDAGNQQLNNVLMRQQPGIYILTVQHGQVIQEFKLVKL